MDQQVREDIIRVYQFWNDQGDGREARDVVDAIYDIPGTDRQDAVVGHIWDRFLETNPWVAQEASRGAVLVGVITRMLEAEMEWWIMQDETHRMFVFKQEPDTGVEFRNLDSEDEVAVGMRVEVPEMCCSLLTAEHVQSLDTTASRKA